MTALDAALKILGWQGGTVHQVREALTKEEMSLIARFNAATDPDLIDLIEHKLAYVQYVLMSLEE